MNLGLGQLKFDSNLAFWLQFELKPAINLDDSSSHMVTILKNRDKNVSRVYFLSLGLGMPM